MNPTAYIALGSNLGDSKATITEAFARLEDLSSTPVRRSSIWRSSPVDCPPDSPDFLNAAALITPLTSSPEELLLQLQSIEKEFGRRPKTIHNEARSLDLDLIAWDAETRATPALTLPHPRAHLRKFVLAPLAEIAPDLILPGQTHTVWNLLNSLNTAEIIDRLAND